MSLDRPFELSRRVRRALFLLIGCGLLSFSVWRLIHTVRFLGRAVRTEGTIIRAEGHPTIRFAGPGGAAIEFVQNGFVSRPEGAGIPVLYDPSDPQGTAEAGTFLPVWGIALWMLPAALGFLYTALVGFEEVPPPPKV